jgi:hypothetical protein
VPLWGRGRFEERSTRGWPETTSAPAAVPLVVSRAFGRQDIFDIVRLAVYSKV